MTAPRTEHARRGGRAATALAVLVVLGWAPRAAGDAPPLPGAARTTLSTDGYALAAPDGVVLTTGVLRHWDLPDGDSALVQGRYLEAGVATGVNPAYGQAGVFVEWAPLAVVQLRAAYDAYGYFGREGSLLRFPSSTSRFGRREIDALAGKEERGLGHRLLLSPTLRAQLGRLVVRNQTDVAWYAMSSTPGWYYEAEYDTLLARRDTLVSNRAALLLELWHGPGEAVLLAGPGHELTHATAAGITRQRAEGLVFWSPADRLAGVQRPRLLAVAGVNLVDRNRRGQPFAVLGIGADVDL